MMQRGFDPRPVARAFWHSVGGKEGFPRQLRGAIAGALPVAVISLPRLTLWAAEDWLRHRGASFFPYKTDRPLRGLLVGQRGHGFIFLDGTMPADDERLTLAHETAHFLHHYQGPRAAALAILGEPIRPVLDGDRPPTASEKLASIMRGAPIGIYSHAIERSSDGLPTPEALQTEIEADLIGFELLAPSNSVAAITAPGKPCRDALQQSYGLPPFAASAWAGWIDARRSKDPLIARLEHYQAKYRA